MQTEHWGRPCVFSEEPEGVSENNCVTGNGFPGLAARPIKSCSRLFQQKSDQDLNNYGLI